MKVLNLKYFPQSLAGARSWLAVQRLWEEHPELRPQLAAGLKRFCRSVNEVVTRR